MSMSSKRSSKRAAWWAAALAVTGLASVAVAIAQPPDRPRGYAHPPHMVYDNRYNHGQYYPERGATVRVLPGGYRPYFYGGHQFYFSGGIWYDGGPGGYIVTRPPVGIYINVLPPFYSTVWFGGVPYYYADDVYYRWIPDQGYQVVDAPAATDQPPGAPAQTPTEDFFIYPKNGQTADQQAADRYECHSWAKGQTGFDPTQPGGGVAPSDTAGKREQYRRAMTACLEARGYSVT